MRNRKLSMRKGWAKLQGVLMLLAVTTAVTALPLTASAASNKALRAKVSFTGDKYTGDEAHDEAIYPKNGYTLSASYLQEAKPSKSMKASADVYIPAASLKADGDCISINLFSGINQGETYIGDVQAKYVINVYKEGSKLVLKKQDTVKYKESNAGKLASAKKSGKYYVVQLKDIPLKNKATVWNEDGSSKNVKIPAGKCWLSSSVEIIGTCSKSSGAVYADNLQLSAGKKLSITFDKKDYAKDGIWGYHNNKDMKLSVAAVK